jgi:NAD-dependent deacetylase
MLELDYFRAHPEKSWPVIREIFYENFDRARPNEAHLALARLENEGWPRGAGPDGLGRLQMLITQNIDSVQ